MACKDSTIADQVMNAGNDATKWFTDYAKVNLNMAQSAANAFSPMLSAWSQWYQSMMPQQLADLYKSYNANLLSYTKSATCDVPTVGCPPKCGCTITWDASQGEQRKSTFKIQNTSKGSVSYTVVPQPFKICGKTLKTTPEVSIQQVSAAPGETVSVIVSLGVSEEFQSGNSYEAEILVRGKYERCVKVVLNVACECDDACSLDVGDIPYKVGFDAWYKHFQCSEPCFEAIPQRSDRGDVTGTVSTANEVKP